MATVSGAASKVAPVDDPLGGEDDVAGGLDHQHVLETGAGTMRALPAASASWTWDDRDVGRQRRDDDDLGPGVGISEGLENRG